MIKTDLEMYAFLFGNIKEDEVLCADVCVSQCTGCMCNCRCTCSGGNSLEFNW